MAVAVSIEAKIVLALTTHFQGVTLPTGCGIAAPNVVFTPDGTHPYVRISVIKNQPINVSISGSREPIRQGLFAAVVCWPIGPGLLPASELAGTIRDKFKFNTRINFAGGYIKVTKEPMVQGDMIENGYSQIPVIIPWQAFA